MNALEKLRSQLDAGHVYRRLELTRWSTAVDRHLRALVGEGALKKMSQGLYYAPRYAKESQPIGFSCDADRVSFNGIGNRFVEIKRVLSRFSLITMTASQGAMDAVNKWDVSMRERIRKGGSTDAMIFARSVPYIFKLAALYYIGSRSFITDARDLLDTIKPYNAPPEEPGQVPLIKESMQIPDRYILEAIRNISEYFLPVAAMVIDDVDVKTSKNVQKQILKIIRENGGWATKSHLLRKLKMKVKDVNEHIDTLEEAESIERIFQCTGKGGRKEEWISLLRSDPQ